MSAVAYTSNVRLDASRDRSASRTCRGSAAGDLQRARRDRRALQSGPRDADRSHAATIDYVIAATAG